MADSPADPPFLRMGPQVPASPVVLSVPHAGRLYSSALLKASRLPLSTLETLEDRLVDRLVSDDSFEAEVDALAERLATGPTRAYAGAKEQLNARLYAGLDEQLELEASLQQGLAGSPDFGEGVTAFLEKRAARFSGE